MGIRFPVRARCFSLLHNVQAKLKAHQVFYPTGNRESFSMIKRPGRKANHLSPSRSEVRNAWPYTSAPPYVFMALSLIKFRNKFFDSPH
jgi:hypothetical protein